MYVDDLLVSGSYDSNINSLKEMPTSQFEMIDLGLLHHYIGMEVWKSKDCIFICQFKYLKQCVTDYRMEKRKHITCPLLPRVALSRSLIFGI